MTAAVAVRSHVAVMVVGIAVLMVGFSVFHDGNRSTAAMSDAAVIESFNHTNSIECSNHKSVTTIDMYFHHFCWRMGWQTNTEL